MLQADPLRERIVSLFDAMSPQLRQAARYIIEHPQEVALVSMRELARNAGVQPSTMTRLAKFLGLAGYDDIRANHAEAIRFRVDGFAARAMQTDESEEDMAAAQLSRRMLQGLAAQIARLTEPASLERLAGGRILLFDKTGTLTAGRPEVAHVSLAPGADEAEVLRLAASLDQMSPHVLATAVVNAARARGMVVDMPTEVEEVLYASGLVAEALVYAKPDEALGSAICAALWASPAASGQAAQDDAALMAHCRQHLPVFMLPRVLQWVDKPLPRSPNGKLDRQRWMQDHGSL